MAAVERRRGVRIGPGGLACAGGLAVAYLLYLRTDAYRRGNRLFYRDGRPNRAGRAFGRLWVAIADVGLTPSYIVTLETIGHRTGRSSAIPLVLAEVGGERYAVSMLGEKSPWVHNVRAAGGRAVIRHGGRREVRLVEVPVDERAPVLKSYLGRAMGARPHIPVSPGAPIAAFEAVAGRYPVFRFEPAGVS
jgi:deazaflavin-dependent oxidoreductase (nitroreductase family)